MESSDIIRDDWSVPAKLEWIISSPELSADTLIELCVQARRYHVGAIRVSPYYAAEAAEALRNSGVTVCAILGDPGGNESPIARLEDAKRSLYAGATALIMPINMMAVRSGRLSDVREEISQIVQAAIGKATISLTIGSELIRDDDAIKVLNLIKSSGVDYVNLHRWPVDSERNETDFETVKRYLGSNVGVTVEGDFYTLESVKRVIHSGADKIGLPDALAIIREIESRPLMGRA